MLLGLANSEHADDNSQRNSKVCKYDTSFKRLTNLFRPLLQLSMEAANTHFGFTNMGQKCVFSELKLFEITKELSDLKS